MLRFGAFHRVGRHSRFAPYPQTGRLVAAGVQLESGELSRHLRERRWGLKLRATRLDARSKCPGLNLEKAVCREKAQKARRRKRCVGRDFHLMGDDALSAVS